jgi:DNA-binding CsgD family transcriptional regulator
LLGVAEAAQRLARLTSAKRHAKLGMRLARDTQDAVLLARLAALSRLIDALRGIDAHQRHSPAGELEAGYLCNEHDAHTSILERWAVGLVELANGRPRTAAAALHQACLRLQEMGVAHPGVYPLLPDAVAALIAADREPEAAALSRQLAEQAARIGGPWPAIASMRCRALLRLSDNDTLRAIDELEQVRLDLRRLGLRLEAARTGVELARAQRRVGLRKVADHTLSESERVFASVGASAWLRRCDDERGRLVGPHGYGDLGELTSGEAQVARLAALGQRSREIAAELCVSVSTVDGHLKVIYRKLGVHSRAQLASVIRVVEAS